MGEKFFYVIMAAAWLQTVASIVSTFSKTMIRLRFASVLANILSLILSVVSADLASFAGSIITLPISVIRLREMRALVARIKSSVANDLNVEWLKPFMRPRQLKDGDVLFRQGDRAAEAYMLVDGRIELPEVGVMLEPGALFGEMALFTAEGDRTASAVCKTDVRLLAITYEEFEQLYFQNPEFGLYLVRLIVRRLQANMGQAEVRLAPAPSSSPLLRADAEETVA